jgi:hypothetical protein
MAKNSYSEHICQKNAKIQNGKAYLKEQRNRNNFSQNQAINKYYGFKRFHQQIY